MFKFGKKHSEKKSDYDLTYDNLAIPEIHTGKRKMNPLPMKTLRIQTVNT